MAGRWLFKTEPSAYAFGDLVKDGRTVWNGIRNPLALQYLAAVAVGDPVLVYHTGGEKAAVGLARVVGGPRPDPKSKRLLVVDLEALRALPRPVTLASIRANRRLARCDLLRMPRLSVVPLPPAEWSEILRMARGDARG